MTAVASVSCVFIDCHLFLLVDEFVLFVLSAAVCFVFWVKFHHLWSCLHERKRGIPKCLETRYMVRCPVSPACRTRQPAMWQSEVESGREGWRVCTVSHEEENVALNQVCTSSLLRHARLMWIFRCVRGWSCRALQSPSGPKF